MELVCVCALEGRVTYVPRVRIIQGRIHHLLHFPSTCIVYRYLVIDDRGNLCLTFNHHRHTKLIFEKKQIRGVWLVMLMIYTLRHLH